MPPPLRPGKTASGPQLARSPINHFDQSTALDIEPSQDFNYHSHGDFRARTGSSPSRLSFSSSVKTPARSFFHRSSHGSLGELEISHFLRCLLTPISPNRHSAYCLTGCSRRHSRVGILGLVRRDAPTRHTIELQSTRLIVLRHHPEQTRHSRNDTRAGSAQP